MHKFFPLKGTTGTPVIFMGEYPLPGVFANLKTEKFTVIKINSIHQWLSWKSSKRAFFPQSYRLFIFSYFFAGVHFALLGDSTLRCNHREPTLLFVNCKWKLNNIKFYLFCSILESAAVPCEMGAVLRCENDVHAVHVDALTVVDFIMLYVTGYMSEGWTMGGQKSKKKIFPRNQAEEHKNLASYAG